MSGLAREAASRLGAACIIALLLVAWLTEPAAAQDQARGLAIMREQEEANRGFQSETALVRMLLIDASEGRSERIMDVRRLEGSGDEGDKTLIVFKTPTDINGTGLLTYQNATGDDDQWLYLPALKRVRRIAAANRASSFVGSEFTYEDLVPLDLARYTFRHLRDDTHAGAPVWVVESIPRAKDSGYSRIEMLVSKDTHQTLRATFYDKRGELLKAARFEQWTRQDGKWWRPGSITMENAQTGKSTVLETQQMKVRAGLTARDFTTRALER